ncbi:hypothetical protein [Alkaliphilus crotonatoxidans]
MWIERIKAYRLSGLSAKKWCEENEFNFHALNLSHQYDFIGTRKYGELKQWC